jgi:endonuclease/exonuclease/phosphatase (EEP) superfamily protein YafD
VPALWAAACCAVLPAIDPQAISVLGWVVDTTANLAAQGLMLAVVAAIVGVFGRRWICAVAALAAALVLAVTVLGVERLPRTARPAGPRVSVLLLNALSRSAEGESQLALILDSGADLVMVNELSGDLLAAIRGDVRLRSAYPHFVIPDRAGPGYRVLLSRYPALTRDDGFGYLWDEVQDLLSPHGFRVARIETPRGPFIFAGVQMRSPRSPARWAAGNRQTSDTAEGLALLAEATRLPVLVGGDFNASPTGWRSRELARRVGLARAKPALRATGTYPAALPWPARTAIDGLLASRGTELMSWRTVAVPGSDHEAVLVELSLPGIAAAE